jgi:pantoate--beta-alanine ligase
MTFARSWVLSNVGTDCYVVASIFVNPTQFNNEHDLEKYPRTFDQDLEVCESAGVDAVFVPTVSEMYPEGLAHVELLDAGELKNQFEGTSRPGHFDGVVTVVNKLFAATQPQYAFFGEKDYQQLTVLKRFVERNKLPITVVGVPTVRAEDRVALSSRNSRLSAHGRQLAAQVPIALDIVQQATSNGVDGDLAMTSARDYLQQFSEIDVDYLVITSNDMTTIPTSGPARALVAVVIEGVRILDNMPIQIRNS